MNQEITVEVTAGSSIRRRTMFTLFAAAACVVLTTCKRKDDDRFPPYDNTAEVEADWKSKPNFYQFKTLADVPALDRHDAILSQRAPTGRFAPL